jgi:hypothetical protein
MDSLMADSEPVGVSVSFLPTHQEIIDWGQQLQRLRRPKFASLLVLGWFIAFAIFGLLLPAASVGSLESLFPSLHGYSSAIFAAALLIFMYVFFRLQRAIDRRLVGRALAQFDPPQTEVFAADESGLSFTTGAISHSCVWSAVREIILLDGSVCFIVGYNTWYVSDRAFSAAEARDDFIRFALSHLSESSRQRSLGTGALATRRSELSPAS